MNVDFSYLKKRIKEINWYRQAAHAKFLYIAIPCLGVSDEMDYPNVFANAREHENYFSLPDMAKEAREFFNKSKNARPIDKYYENYYPNLVKAEKSLERLEKVNFELEPLEKITLLLREMDYWSYMMWYTCFIVDKFDPEGEDLVKKEIGIDIFPEDFFSLTKPWKMNFLEKYRLELLKNKKNFRSILDEFYYLKNSWGNVVYISEQDIRNDLDEIKKLSPSETKSQIYRFEHFKEELEKEAKAVFKKYNLSTNLDNIFHLFRILGQIRDKRKEIVLKCNHFYDKYAKRLGKELKIDYKLLYNALPQEILKNPNNISKLVPELEKRKQGIIIGHVESKQFFIVSGKQANELIEILHEKVKQQQDIKGMVACKAEKIIKGKVKIVLGESHFTKFEKGDILVASMTRPEYVPLMKKAAVIITDEGGITCHAAIISRELKKPCIIGTKVATKSLRDGDIVEVDADKGIIRKVVA